MLHLLSWGKKLVKGDWWVNFCQVDNDDDIKALTIIKNIQCTINDWTKKNLILRKKLIKLMKHVLKLVILAHYIESTKALHCNDML